MLNKIFSRIPQNAVVTIVIGLLFLIAPLLMPKLILSVIGALLLISECAVLFRFFRSGSDFNADTLFHILKAAAGLWLLFRAESVIGMLSYFCGGILTALGLFLLLRRLRGSYAPGLFRIIGIAVSAAILASGIAMLVHPVASAAKLFSWMGILLILRGVFSILESRRTPHDPDVIWDI